MPPEQVAWIKAKCANYERDNHDPIVDSVLKKYQERSSVGVNKYNTTLEQNNKDNYLQHLQQELMDGSLYIEKLLQQKQDITQLIKDYPNNNDLGKIIRNIYGSY